jgi:hypothetical protein
VREKSKGLSGAAVTAAAAPAVAVAAAAGALVGAPAQSSEQGPPANAPAAEGGYWIDIRRRTIAAARGSRRIIIIAPLAREEEGT